MKTVMIALVLLVTAMPALAQSEYGPSLSYQFDQRDPVLQAKRHREEAQLDKDTTNTLNKLEQTAHSKWSRDRDNLDCSLDGSEPQLCYYKMENGLICETRTIDNRLVTKIRCY